MLRIKTERNLRILAAFLFFLTALSSMSCLPVGKTTGVTSKALLLSTTVSPPGSGPISTSFPVPAPTARNIFYIDPAGNDATGDGTVTRPWRSLYRATTKVQTPGSLIHANAGTYLEQQECPLAVGVSIEGVGNSTVIKSLFQTQRTGNVVHGAIALVSPSEGTDGNQSISNLKLDGDHLTGSIGIAVSRRSNVKIHDVTIVDFYMNGVTFTGAAGGSYVRPGIYAIGNELSHSNISNCGDTPGTWEGGAILQWSGQIGLSVHDNVFNNTSRAQGHNGNIVNASYYMRGTKYYNNTSYKPDYDGTAWNFHIESWNSEGGFEINNNRFYGGDCAIDVAGKFHTKGSYSYSVFIHDNLFKDTPAQTYHGKHSVEIETWSGSDFIVRSNHFLNIVSPIFVIDAGTINGERNIQGSFLSNISIDHNILENSGWNDPAKYENLINVYVSSATSTFTNVNIDNNVILSNPIAHNAAISFNVVGNLKNVSVRNNIILGCRNGAFMYVTNNGGIDGLTINENVLYQNSGGNLPIFRGTQTMSHYEFLNNINSDPLFVSSTDFQLLPTSPALNAGAYVGLPIQ